jgi:hypothetical protein
MGVLEKIAGHEMDCKVSHNKARAEFETALHAADLKLQTEKALLYKTNPVILIHRITANSLPEGDLLQLHNADTKIERKELRQLLVSKYKILLLQQYTKEEITYEQLLDIVK